VTTINLGSCGAIFVRPSALLTEGGRSSQPVGFLAEITQLSIKVFLKRLAALGNKEQSRQGAMSITQK